MNYLSEEALIPPLTAKYFKSLRRANKIWRTSTTGAPILQVCSKMSCGSVVAALTESNKSDQSGAEKPGSSGNWHRLEGNFNLSKIFSN